MSVTISLVNPPEGTVFWMPRISYGYDDFCNWEYRSLSQSDTIQIPSDVPSVFNCELRITCWDGFYGIIDQSIKLVIIENGKKYEYDFAGYTFTEVTGNGGDGDEKPSNIGLWVGVGIVALLGVLMLVVTPTKRVST